MARLRPGGTPTQEQRRVVYKAQPVAIWIEAVEGTLAPRALLNGRQLAGTRAYRPFVSGVEVSGRQIQVIWRWLQWPLCFHASVDQCQDHVTAMEVKPTWNCVVCDHREHCLVKLARALDV